MAKEDQQASRAASRFPLPAGVRCKAAVEKPANNGPGAQVPGWTLRGELMWLRCRALGCQNFED